MVIDSPQRYIAIVPAAGVGKRMGSDKPKQYIRIAGKTVLEHTVEHLLAANVFEQIILAVNTTDTYWESIELLKNPIIRIVKGGAERSDSVLAAMQSYTAKSNDWVLVHDVARPCITPESIQFLIEHVKDHSVGGILAIPVSDTVKRVHNEHVNETIDRRELWRAQTPQMFPYSLLRTALEQGIAKQLAITDEASAVEFMGLQPKIIEGLPSNIKITCPEDIELAMFYLQQTKAL